MRYKYIMAHKTKKSSIKLTDKILEVVATKNNATFNYRQMSAALV